MQYNGFDENSDTLIKGELDLHVYTSKTTTIEDEILYNILLDNYDGSYKILITFNHLIFTNDYNQTMKNLNSKSKPRNLLIDNLLYDDQNSYE